MFQHLNGAAPTPRIRVGRPTDFNAQTSETIIALVKRGNFIETAAAFAGVTARTVRNWIAKGKRRDQPVYGEFRRPILQAKAEAEIHDLEKLSRDPAWQATTWRLERRNPRRWARPTIRYVEHAIPEPSRPLKDVVREIEMVLAHRGHQPADESQ